MKCASQARDQIRGLFAQSPEGEACELFRILLAPVNALIAYEDVPQLSPSCSLARKQPNRRALIQRRQVEANPLLGGSQLGLPQQLTSSSRVAFSRYLTEETNSYGTAATCVGPS